MYKRFFKRLIDLLAALVLMGITALLFVFIALWIKLDSKGPIFYKQTRIGKDGKTFKIYKFRSMVSNADQIGGYATQPGDNRITKVGQFLRKTSLDELPQVLNILFGDMSLIGPRPDVPAQRENYSDQEFTDRHLVLPGITGLAQCRNRHDTTIRSRKQYDIFYNRHVGFCLDMLIIYWTLLTLKKGSY